MRKTRAGFMFLELLLVLAIMVFIGLTVFNLYFKSPLLDQETKKAAVESGVDTTTYKTTIDSTKEKVDNIQNKHFEEMDKLDKNL